MAFQTLNGTDPSVTAAKQQAAAQSDTFLRTVQAAFHQQPQLCSDILNSATPFQYDLFTRIANHVLSLQAQVDGPARAAGGEQSKKRKLDAFQNGSSAVPGPSSGSSTGPIRRTRMIMECRDVSFAVPARKKFKLQVVADEADPARTELRALNSQSDAVEFTVPLDQIEAAFSLPVPEKQQRQQNYVLIPKDGSLGADGKQLEQVVFTQNETPIKEDTARTALESITEDSTYSSITLNALRTALAAGSCCLVLPSDNEFASSIPQPHRKGERAYHVKAHKGSKEGYLFFLSNGILFGFKKPLQFFPFSDIESISYTSVLQRTFNLVITSMPAANEGGESAENEFSMLDQADFAGIDTYIKGHGLNDASMAAERRAKAYNVNKERKGGSEADAAGDGAAGVDEQSELQKAEQQLQDEEDELEEDYDPSGGESEGEGDYSEEERDEYGEGYDEEVGEVEEEEEDIAEE